MPDFFRENWLWRGTQSAIFYYVSCSPCIEARYKRKRRNEAARSEKQKAEIITMQPGRVQQPGAFQTNEAWAEEILKGPGPPKGWKSDPVVNKLSAGERDRIMHEGPHFHGPQAGDAVSREPREVVQAEQSESFPALTSIPERTSEESSSSSSSSASDTGLAQRSRPSLDRRLSTAMDNLKDHFKSTIRPEKWNWKRYERDDEILSGLTHKMRDMWDRATSFGHNANDENEPWRLSHGRKRAETDGSDRYDYQTTSRNPEINELHPPAVSQLPATRDGAAWMLLPAPSAAVMAGRARPIDEPALRWPLARITRSADEWEQLKMQQEVVDSKVEDDVSKRSEEIPELSNSSSEESSIEDDGSSCRANKRHSAPPSGWTSFVDVAVLKARNKTWRERMWWSHFSSEPELSDQ